MKPNSLKPETVNVIGQRLKYEMKSRGINSAELAKRADVKTSFIYDVISGKSANPSSVKLARVAEGLGITLTSLVNSSKEEKFDQPYPESGSDYIAIPTLSISCKSNTADKIRSSADDQPFRFSRSWIIKYLNTMPDNLRMFTMSGDSMETTLGHKDILLVDIADKNPTQPGLFILFDGYGISVKRVERIMNSVSPRIRILSDNPQYSIYESSPADAGIIGRVVWFSRGI